MSLPDFALGLASGAVSALTLKFAWKTLRQTRRAGRSRGLVLQRLDFGGLKLFLASCTAADPDQSVPVDVLYQAYLDWGRALDLASAECLTKRPFCANLKLQGYSMHRRPSGQRVFRGLRLLELTPGEILPQGEFHASV